MGQRERERERERERDGDGDVPVTPDHKPFIRTAAYAVLPRGLLEHTRVLFEVDHDIFALPEKNGEKKKERRNEVCINLYE